MTQSPPTGSASSRPPTASSADGGRLITAGAAGASVLLLSVTAVVLWPRTYGAEATLVLDGNAQVQEPIKLAGRIEAALLEREVLASAAMDLPPELRSPDPIGRLRSGIRVQSRGALGYVVEFRGSDPQSVQRIANRLVDRAVALVPKLATSPEDAAPLIDLTAKSRAVTEFLTAHPEITVEPSGDKVGRPAGSDRGLDLLRTEKRQIEQRLATGASDNPYADPGDNPTVLTRRLAEIKLAIARREAALKQPKAETPPAVSPELTAEWRTLLSQLADAQARASRPTSKPIVTAHVTSRAALPTSPLTPNRLVLSIVAVLLSLAAAMLAYVLPRKAVVPQRQQPRGNAPPAAAPGDPSAAAGNAARTPSDRPPANEASVGRSDPPPAQRSDPPPAQRSDPPPAGAPGPMAPMRTVVLSSGGSSSAPPRAEATPRRRTSPGGLEAPTQAQITALATTGARPNASPAAPLFGSRPPPGAGSYSVSSSHPPPFDGSASGARTSVERLSPLQSQRPPAPSPAPEHPGTIPPAAGNTPPIVSRPPALDPDAERWAARFETPPPPADDEPPKRGGAGRWKTQVMGSMVPLEVQTAREDRQPLSEPRVAFTPEVVAVQQAPTPAASTVVQHDVPHGWRPAVDASHPHVAGLRDAILKQGFSRHLRVAVTSAPGGPKAHVACGLALSLAEAGARVLLLEADFDQPQLHQIMSVSAPVGAGFSQQIIARKQGVPSRPWVVLRCSPTLQVLAEGRLRSPGILALEEFGRAIRELGELHHVLVMHAPSLDKPSDLRALDQLAQVAVLAQSDQPPTIHFGGNPLRQLMEPGRA